MSINWTNFTSPEQIPSLPNQNTDGSFWTVTLYMIWAVFLVIFTYFGFEVAILTSSVIGLIAALFLTYAGLVSWANVLFFAAILLFYLAYIIWSSYRS